MVFFYVYVVPYLVLGGLLIFHSQWLAFVTIWLSGRKTRDNLFFFFACVISTEQSVLRTPGSTIVSGWFIDRS